MNQCTSVQYGWVQCNLEQYSEGECTSVQRRAINYSTKQNSRVQRRSVQLRTGRVKIVQYRIALTNKLKNLLHYTVQYSTQQYKAMQFSPGQKKVSTWQVSSAQKWCTYRMSRDQQLNRRYVVLGIQLMNLKAKDMWYNDSGEKTTTGQDRWN